MNFKAEIKKRVFTTNNVKRLCTISFKIYHLRRAINLKTIGSSQFRFLAFNKMLEGQIGKILTIGIARHEDFSDEALVKFNNWALKNSEKHITIFISPERRAGKLIIGDSYKHIFNDEDISVQLQHLNDHFRDGQFLKGVEDVILHIKTVLKI